MAYQASQAGRQAGADLPFGEVSSLVVSQAGRQALTFPPGKEAV